MDDILGPIPKQEELLTEIKTIEDEIKAESEESTGMVSSYAGKQQKAAPTVLLPEADEIAPPPPAPRPTGPSAPSTTNTASAPTDQRRRRPTDPPP
jgi:hypothetical protein